MPQQSSTSLPFLRSVWVLSEGSRGMENQCLGLAEALDLTPDIKRIALRGPWRYLPPWIFPLPFWGLAPSSDKLVPPWPDLLIACGRKAVPYAMTIRHMSAGGTFTVVTQNPTVSPKHFDIVVPPAHDRIEGKNVFPILGSPHRVTASRLAEAAKQFENRFASLKRPLIGVMIGGPNKVFDMTAADQDKLVGDLKSIAQKENAGFAITISRRTPLSFVKKLKGALEGISHDLFAGEGENPYLGILALSDALIVTADSVNMATEAAATGKPLYIATLQGGSEKFDRFHGALATRSIARPLNGQIENWTYPPLNETARAAEFIRSRMALRFYRRTTRLR